MMASENGLTPGGAKPVFIGGAWLVTAQPWSRRITAKIYQVRQIVLYFLWQKKFFGQVLLSVRFPCSVCGDAYMAKSFNSHLKAIHEA